MEVLVVIPARGGSKRLPSKNLLDLGGKPLIAHSVIHAKHSKLVSRIIVSTDSEEIAEVAKKYGAEVIIRPKELAGDAATSESAILHVLDYLKDKEKYVPDIVVFLQCTSPLRRKDDSDNAIKMVAEGKCDSCFSACKNDKLFWRIHNSEPLPINYDYRNRKREQEFEQQYMENGSIYVFRPELFRKHSNRMNGRLMIYDMHYLDSFQVDSLEDLQLIRWIYDGRGKIKEGSL